MSRPSFDVADPCVKRVVRNCQRRALGPPLRRSTVAASERCHLTIVGAVRER
jgi:hypothetical protein